MTMTSLSAVGHGAVHPPPPPRQAVIEALSRHCRVVLADEHFTSAKCSLCRPKGNVFVTDDPSRRLVHCSLHNGSIPRDVNAAVNIEVLTQHWLRTGQRPEYLDSPHAWRFTRGVSAVGWSSMSALQLERTLDFTTAEDFAQFFEDMSKSEDEAREARYGKGGKKKGRGRKRRLAADDATPADDDGAAGGHGKRSGTAATVQRRRRRKRLLNHWQLQSGAAVSGGGHGGGSVSTTSATMTTTATSTATTTAPPTTSVTGERPTHVPDGSQGCTGAGAATSRQDFNVLPVASPDARDRLAPLEC